MLEGGLGERVPFERTVTQAEGLDGGVRKAAFPEIRKAYALPLVGFPKLLLKKTLGKGRHLKQGFPMVELLGFFGGARGLLHSNAVFGRQGFEGFRIG